MGIQPRCSKNKYIADQTYDVYCIIFLVLAQKSIFAV